MQSATAILTGNLPAEPNSFIGRERDLAELARLLGEVRALTLSGPGGIGKTRLAVRLARDVLSGESPDADEGPRDLDEAWLVELADWHGPVAQAVATTLGVREEQGVPLAQTLAEALRSRHMLLILDTCEHQVSDCATLVQLLLARCPWLRIIATSREPLRVRGETVWRVPPLDLPPDGASGAELAAHEAVRLFAARAAGARPGFTLTSDNTASVARLCRTLDGIPLGIELSAARVRALSVEQIEGRLRDRFQLLNSGDRTAPLRQQTLRATVDWSYELLDEAEQMLLRRLATFSGWNLDMAEQVCSDEAIGAEEVLGLLISLIDKSLVVLDGEAAGDARYRLLDTIREYAAERLEAAGEKDALALRHRDCILALVEETVATMFNRGEPPWPVRRAVFRRGIAEYGNFRIALATSLAHGHADEGLRLCIGLRNMWLPHGDAREAVTWLDRFLVLPGGEVSPSVRGRALAVRAEIAFDLQDYDTLVRCATESLELSRASGDDFPVPTALRVISQAAARAGRAGEAVAYIEEAIAAAEAAGNDWEAGLTQATKAAIAVRQGKLKSAQRAYETALDVLTDNNRWGIAQVEYGMGTLARTRGDAEMAVRYYADAMEIFRELDAWPEIARCQAGIGWIAVTSGDYDQAAGQPGRGAAAEPDRRPAARHRPRPGGVRRAGRGPAAARAGGPAGRRGLPAARVSRARDRDRPADRGGARVRPRPARHVGRGRPVRRGPRDGRRGRCRLRARPGPEPARARTRGGRRTGLDRPVPAGRRLRFRAAPRHCQRGQRRRAPRTHAAHPARARDRVADRPGALQPGDRRRAGDQPGDRRQARGQHPGQARLQLAYTSCLMGHPPRLVQLTSACTCARGTGS